MTNFSVIFKPIIIWIFAIMRQTLIKDGSFVLLKTHQLEIPKESVCILVNKQTICI